MTKLKRGQHRGYQAQVCGKYLGTFGNQEEAAQAVAEHTGVQVTILNRKASQTVNVDDQMQRFKALVGIYTDEDGTAEVISDITESVKVL